MPRVTKKKRKAVVKNDKCLHSITFYIPNKKIEFFTEALKEVSKRIYSSGDKRTVSKYIRDLIYSDFQKRNLLDEDNNPNLDELIRIKGGGDA
jgi:hypothetical protein